MTTKGKEPQVMELKEGDAMYLPTVTHLAKNVETTTIKLIVTEMKPSRKMTATAMNEK